MQGETGYPRYSHNWALSRRGQLKLYDDRLEFGEWFIAYRDFHDAVLYESRQMLIPVYILAVTAHAKCYQFGLTPWALWRRKLPFQARRERVRLGYSPFSVVSRIFVLGCLVYLVWRLFR
jgi:hypothetical protein